MGLMVKRFNKGQSQLATCLLPFSQGVTWRCYWRLSSHFGTMSWYTWFSVTFSWVQFPVSRIIVIGVYWASTECVLSARQCAKWFIFMISFTLLYDPYYSHIVNDTYNDTPILQMRKLKLRDYKLLVLEWLSVNIGLFHSKASALKKIGWLFIMSLCYIGR